MDRNRIVIISVEPSKEFSQMLGFPYYIEKKVTVGEMFDQGIVTEVDVLEMESGKQIMKSVPIARD